MPQSALLIEYYTAIFQNTINIFRSFCDREYFPSLRMLLAAVLVSCIISEAGAGSDSNKTGIKDLFLNY